MRRSGRPRMSGPPAMVRCIASTRSVTLRVASTASRLAPRRSSTRLRFFLVTSSTTRTARHAPPQRGPVDRMLLDGRERTRRRSAARLTAGRSEHAALAGRREVWTSNRSRSCSGCGKGRHLTTNPVPSSRGSAQRWVPGRPSIRAGVGIAPPDRFWRVPAGGLRPDRFAARAPAGKRWAFGRLRRRQPIDFIEDILNVGASQACLVRERRDRTRGRRNHRSTGCFHYCRRMDVIRSERR